MKNLDPVVEKLGLQGFDSVPLLQIFVSKVAISKA
jgi:hypothetical protein